MLDDLQLALAAARQADLEDAVARRASVPVLAVHAVSCAADARLLLEEVLLNRREQAGPTDWSTVYDGFYVDQDVDSGGV